jgi:hypothetical protein
MPWDLETARAVAGIAPGDTTHDEALQSVMDFVISDLEARLGRGILLMRTTERYYNVNTRELCLYRYPIRQVFSPDCRIVYRNAGWIEPEEYQDIIDVDYEGGFDPVPPNLLGAMWEAFLLRWESVDQTTGLPVPGGGATVIQGSGDISSVTVDGMTIRYDVGASVSGDSGSVSAALQADWGWLAPWASILSIYRSERAPGVAIA